MSLNPLRICLTLGVLGLAVAATSQIAPLNLERTPYVTEQAASAATAPHALAESIDVATIPVSRRRIQVPMAGNLQAALDRAVPGDVIELENGATYEGPFHLRRKDGDGWIVVTTASVDSLSAQGERVSPPQAALLAKLRASSDSVIAADAGAHHYRFVGVEIFPSDGTSLNALVQLGDNESHTDLLPHHIIFDRCYFHGDPAKGTRRGIALNSRYSAIINSYFSDFKEVGADSQAIAGWNGPGPFTIANNYLEAAGENLMFGGADPSIQGLVPADIQVTDNHLAKPLRWRKEDPEFEGTPWTVKNLFELKNARRVIVDGNLFENNWPEAQNGFAILLTVRNQSGGAPWSVVEDVVFANNVIRHAGAGINILGRDDNHRSQQTSRIAIRGNLFVDIGGRWGSGRLFQLLDGTRDVSISHNTAFQTGAAVFGGDHAPHTGFVFEKNLVLHNQFGIGGSGSGIGRPALARYFPGSVVRRNVFVGGDAEIYPLDNAFPATIEAAGYVRDGDGSYRRGGRPVESSAAGIGADIDALTSRMERVSAGRGRAAETTVRQGGVSQGGPGEWNAEARSAELLFWGSLFLLGYVYAGYPVIAWLRSRLLPRHQLRVASEPTVSVVVAAHNESGRIDARIQNLLTLDYPSDRLEIIVGSDGSTDDTAWRASAYEDAGVRVEAFRKWRGKAAVLNDLVRTATGKIILFADARQRFDRGVIRNLVSHFADPTVGAVSGELMVSADDNGTSVGRGTSFYWRYEKFIRLHESRAASTVGATGAIYAIRRALFRPIPNDTILDDVLIPLNIVRQGYAVRFEPAAKAFESASTNAHQECVRKLRTIAGTFQLFARQRWLLNPLRNPLWFQTISHKGLRLLLPIVHAAALMANLALNDGGFYSWTLLAQVSFYGAALAGHALRHARHRPLLITVPYAMCLMLWATVAGFFRFVTHRQSVMWEQSAPQVIPRSPSPAR
jgi:cellulose synthase/poly-beta-1,6-N-acetylglucosamine synthase-like glycosyltransferase